jgi:DnaJ-class molecular chaperone
VQDIRVGPGMTMRQQVHCPHCRGKGKTFKHVCGQCRGQRVVRRSKEFEIEVEKGMRDGQQVVFEYESEQSPDYLPGDVM